MGRSRHSRASSLGLPGVAVLALLLLAGTTTLAGCSPGSASESTQTPEPQTIWPQLQRIEPSPAIIGEKLLVVGSGGYIQFESEGIIGYDESFRTFTLTLNEEEIGEIGCYVNRCEGEIIIPATLAVGSHELAVEGGSMLTIEVVQN